MAFLDQILFGNSLRAWGLAILGAALFMAVLWVFKSILLNRIVKFSGKTKNQLDDILADVLGHTNFFLMALVVLYLSFRFLKFPETFHYWTSRIALFAFLIQVAIWGDALITNSVRRYQERNLQNGAGRVTALRAVSFIVKLVLFSIVILLALDNIGIQITSLVASLGIGSIAVALAVQNILADLFASLSIALDQPFVIGDFIIVGDYLGTVENIGLKTTRVRSLSGEQLVFSNNDLLGSRIHNYKRMEERRVVFSFGVLYQTSIDLMEKIPGMVKDTIEAQDKTRFDRAHFKSFGDSSLDFEAVYYVLSPDYNLYMDTQQAINLTLMRLFEKDGIEFAYPTRTIFIEKEEGESQPA